MSGNNPAQEGEPAMWVEKKRPKFVYKYCAAPRAAQILCDLTFYFCPARDLNDLYEFSVRAMYREDADSKCRVYAKRLVASGAFSDPVEALEAARGMGEKGADETYGHFLEVLHAQLRPLIEHSAVTCFTSAPNNQRMWGTYGAQHSGAVLEFTTDKQLSPFASNLSPVAYTATRPPICPSFLVTDAQKLDLLLVGMFFSLKSIDWKEEREWRLLLLSDREIEPADRLVEFPRPALTRIFIGPRISPEHEEAIRTAAARHSPPVPVFARSVDSEKGVEEPVGLEEIHFDAQLQYWLSRIRPKKPS